MGTEAFAPQKGTEPAAAGAHGTTQARAIVKHSDWFIAAAPLADKGF
jgi:hypothetical protein